MAIERERGGVGISRCQVELSAMIRWRNIHSASFNVEIPHVDVVLSCSFHFSLVLDMCKF